MDLPAASVVADITDRLDAARERIGREIFASWSAQDVSELVRLMAKFAGALESREREP
jgi:acyl-CoA reductase-like NAD-dependent aldehyde dehydrogenase